MQEQTAAPAKTLTELKSPPARELALQDVKIDMFSMRGFELAQRIAKAFSTSDAVPAIFQSQIAKKDKGQIVAWVENPSAFGNCLIAIETAQSVGMSITAVMQNANVIEGRLSWSGKFIIAAVNASRRFTPIRFKIVNKGMIKATYKEKDGWNKEKNKWNMVDHSVELENIECTAWAYIIEDGKATSERIEGAPVSMKMAVEEGWYAKPGSKWQTEMKHLMLQYRSGAYFGNIHAPDVVMGMGKTTEEMQDTSNTIDVELQPNGSYAASATSIEELRGHESTAQRQQPEAETVVVRDLHPESDKAPEEDKPGACATTETAAAPAKRARRAASGPVE